MCNHNPLQRECYHRTEDGGGENLANGDVKDRYFNEVTILEITEGGKRIKGTTCAF